MVKSQQMVIVIVIESIFNSSVLKHCQKNIGFTDNEKYVFVVVAIL
jgi:hypothetical protein